ncbi:MAG: hypothetical protein M3033_18205 [Acidobacteriota bacterium]|nr:hypothetical protein [Acidobacteriota bacterium]
MTKDETQTLTLVSKDLQREFEPKTQKRIEIKETETVISAETISARDFSAVFARLKKSARKKSSGIL